MTQQFFEDQPTIVVFAGAHDGANPEHMVVAYELGKAIAAEGYTLANGAGLGLMGEVSRGAFENGGKVLGVGLQGKEPNKFVTVYHERIGIHSRQSYLFSLGDAFIALPGGMGSLYESMEISELKKLGEEEPEPVVMINHEGFYSDYKNQLDKMAALGYIPGEVSQFVQFVENPAEAITEIKKFYKL